MTYSLDFRERALSYVRDGHSQADCCRVFKIDPKTLYNWLRRQDLACKPSGPRRRKLDRAALAAHVRDYPDAYLHERASYFKVHASSISRMLRKLNIRKKNS